MHLDDLDQAQKTAATAPNGPHLVVAGAGTGKTRTLVHRVAWLLEQGVAPERVVLLTFTRRAAREMLDRVQQLAGPRARRVRGGTFHSFAHGTLRRHAGAVGFSQGFTILDRPDAEALVGLVRAELGLGGSGRRFPKRNKLLALISRSINTGRDLAWIVEEQAPQHLDDVDDIERVADRYRERKREQAVVDYDDLLVLLARLLRENEGLRRTISRSCEHVLVDEYQDTNRLQAQIACLLSSVHGNLMVVGDEAQSIYGFRGAVVRNILDFPDLFPDCATTLIETSYRCTQPVLDLANAVLESADEGFDKRLTAAHAGGERPVLIDVPAEHDQADAVLQEILALREADIGLDRQAVLFRSSMHAHLLEVALTEVGIPFKKYGGLRFSEAAHIKDVVALLRLVHNPRDVLAWTRVLPWFEGLGAKTAQRIAEGVRQAAAPKLDPEPYARRKYGPDLLALAKLLDDAEPLVAHVHDLLAHLMAWYQERMPLLYDDFHRRRRDLDSLAVLAERYSSLDDLLAQLALDPVERSDLTGTDPEDEVLTLSTIHSAKGLEWDAVHLLSLADGGFPNGYALDDAEALEEERRLLYVAVTRAKRVLRLVRPRFLSGRRAMTAGPGCTLLDDLPELDHLVELRRWQPPEVAMLPGPGDEDEAERVARMLDYFR